MSLRSLILRCIRLCGGFSLAKFLTRKRLRILCYHGFAVSDENAFAPLMFMRAAVFEGRMRVLKKHRIPVISLDEAIQRFASGSVRHAETVITLDDGWTTTRTIGWPILERFGYPACVYVSTEHLSAGNEVFDVTLTYMIHRSACDTLHVVGIHPKADGVYDLASDRQGATRRLIDALQGTLSLPERQAALRTIADSLGMKLDDELRDGRFQLLTRSEIEDLASRGMDIQLHTHSHRLPDHAFEAVANEIEQNRAALRGLAPNELRHFCYPSGFHSSRHPEWLRRLGIVSATTCDPGLNGRRVSPLVLRRYLDSDDVSDLEFEAEICGVRELAREIRSRLGLLRRVAP